jgi:hypothetical protein
MVPRFFSSQHLSQFLIYLTGMTTPPELGGPAIVLVLAVLTSRIKITIAAIVKRPVPSQWPLVLALTIVGLAPALPG